MPLARGRARRATCVFLASDRASYISGVVMTLDGGQAARH
jgi:NAD(P)-dependent dehydrogenase (short-subunit alcohol dehydrogenase family)